MRVLLHVLCEVHDLLGEDGHHDAGRAGVLLVLAPLELSGLSGKLVEVSLREDTRVGRSGKQGKCGREGNRISDEGPRHLGGWVPAWCV